MWSHYANNDGICLAFDFYLTNTFALGGVKLGGLDGNSGAYYGKVDYSTVFFTLSYDGGYGFGANEIKEFMTHKLPNWSYENEERIWIVGRTNVGIAMLPHTIKEVIFGIRSTDVDKESIYTKYQNEYSFFQIDVDPKNDRYIKKSYP
jgi:hypothetical protein